MASPIQADTVAFCRKCGKPLTVETRREWEGIPYCEPCVEQVRAAAGDRATVATGAAAGTAGAAAGAQAGAPSGEHARTGPHSNAVPPRSMPRYGPPAANGSVSPVLAGILGFIPGVGAVYNGQFAKGILHVVIFGLLVSIIAAEGTGDLRPMFVFLLILFGCYMPVEAYRTARAIEQGEPTEEFSGILSVFGGKRPSPAGGIVMIILGVLFLFNTLGYWRLGDLVHYWPVLLIALGIYMLYRNVSEQARESRMEEYKAQRSASPLSGARREDPPAGSETRHEPVQAEPASPPEEDLAEDRSEHVPNQTSS